MCHVLIPTKYFWQIAYWKETGSAVELTFLCTEIPRVKRPDCTAPFIINPSLNSMPMSRNSSQQMEMSTGRDWDIQKRSSWGFIFPVLCTWASQSRSNHYSCQRAAPSGKVAQMYTYRILHKFYNPHVNHLHGTILLLISVKIASGLLY